MKDANLLLTYAKEVLNVRKMDWFKMDVIQSYSKAITEFEENGKIGLIAIFGSFF